jgi:hypothetical protein
LQYTNKQRSKQQHHPKRDAEKDKAQTHEPRNWQQPDALWVPHEAKSARGLVAGAELVFVPHDEDRLLRCAHSSGSIEQ